MNVHVPATENFVVTEGAKNKTFWHHTRKYLREYSDVTGIQGLRYVTEKRTRTEKIFWAIVLLLSLTGCIYMMREIIVKFQTSPVVINFTNRFTPIYEIPFPAVTICPEPKTSKKKFNYTDVTQRLSQQGPESLTDKEWQYLNYMSLICHDDDEIDGDDTVDDDLFGIFNWIKPDFNITSDFMNQDFPNTNDVFTTIITDEGICYTFNMLHHSEMFSDYVVNNNISNGFKRKSEYDGDNGYDKKAGIKTYPYRALMSGADYSLVLYLAGFSDDNDYTCHDLFQGSKVVIHHPFDFPRISNDYFQLPSGNEVRVAIVPQLIKTSEEVRNLKPKDRNCYLTTEKHLKYFKIYTQSNCFFECLTNHTLNQCGCVSFYMPRDARDETLLCGINKTECADNVTFNVILDDATSKISDNNNINEAECDCRPLCTDLSYNIEIRQSKFDLGKLYKVWNLSDDGHDAYSSLTVYFKSPQFIPLERNVLYGMSDLISNFGGILGLFTGFSLITLAEIAYFVTIRIFYNRRLYGIWSGPPN